MVGKALINLKSTFKNNKGSKTWHWQNKTKNKAQIQAASLESNEVQRVIHSLQSPIRV